MKAGTRFIALLLLGMTVAVPAQAATTDLMGQAGPAAAPRAIASAQLTQEGRPGGRTEVTITGELRLDTQRHGKDFRLVSPNGSSVRVTARDGALLRPYVGRRVQIKGYYDGIAYAQGSPSDRFPKPPVQNEQVLVAVEIKLLQDPGQPRK